MRCVSRLRRTVTLATTTAVAAALTAVALTAVTASGEPADLHPPDDTTAAGELRLSLTATDPNLLTELRDELGTVGVGDVLDSANRDARACSPTLTHRTASFCWDSGDSGVAYWMPQGITTSGDATADGTVDGREALLAAWYDNDSGRDMGVRISFVDMADRESPVYRHVLLVEPSWDDGAASFGPVNAHAGGIIWYGDQLYVNNTFNGMRVFDMNDLMAVDSGDNTLIGRQPDGSFHAHNYAYVLPQQAHYQPSSTGGEPDLRYSEAALDRTTDPHSIVVGEFGNPGPDTRIARFEMDESDHRFAEDEDGYARATWWQTVGIRSMQGIVSVDGRFHIHRSNGSSNRGDVFIWTPGSIAAEHPSALPIGPEDLTYWPQYDEIWSQTEYPGTRYVYATRESAW